MVVDMTNSAHVGTYTGLYYLFSTLSAIAGPLFFGLIVSGTGNNYNSMMIVAPIFMAIAIIMMWGVKRGEALPQPELVPQEIGTQPQIAENVPPN